MATMQEVLRVIASCTGFPIEDVSEIGQALAGEWDERPACDGFVYPGLHPGFVVRVLLALAATAKPNDAREVAEKYYNLRNTDPNGVSRAGEMIEMMLHAFYTGERAETAKVAFHSGFEVCQASPGIQWATETSGGTKKVVFLDNNAEGLLLAFSRVNEYVRRSCELRGRVLYHIAHELKQLQPIHRMTMPFTLKEVGGVPV